MDAIICRGCNKIYDEPLSLSCGDVLCKRCVSESNDCKICHQKVTYCILNKSMKSYIESLTVRSCSNHNNNNNNEKKTTSYCLQCESFNNMEQISAIHTYH